MATLNDVLVLIAAGRRLIQAATEIGAMTDGISERELMRVRERAVTSDRAFDLALRRASGLDPMTPIEEILHAVDDVGMVLRRLESSMTGVSGSSDEPIDLDENGRQSGGEQ